MEYLKFEHLLGSWGESLKPFIESAACDRIYATLKTEAKRGKTICPVSAETYRAFYETPMSDLRVIFLMQDPYPWEKFGTLVADGIAMSCSHHKTAQPSLDKFYEAIEEDVYDGLTLKRFPSLDLKYLCNQGVMMLNSSLTCELNKTNSHFELWKPFTTFLFEEVLTQFKGKLIIVLCGEHSHYYERFINPLQHYLFKLEHPAHAARRERKWVHDHIFRKINTLVAEHKQSTIEWMEELPF
jgi:uracil-DNA glycosylase